MRNRFTPSFDELPDVLPVFPLTGAVILPNGQLPLNIFEERYRLMVQHCLEEKSNFGVILIMLVCVDCKIRVNGILGRKQDHNSHLQRRI